jgi:predicted nuclease of restriction endonuclease-like (RecB) superfamily
MRALASTWPEGLSDRLRDLPWGHVVEIATTAKPEARQWYAERAGAWSRAQLEAAIATRLHEREAVAITNFEQTLQAGDAEAVQRITRDPLVLDFVELTESARERDLEAALLSDIERFMLALGEGFYFAGRQRSLQVGGEEFILDLLFAKAGDTGLVPSRDPRRTTAMPGNGSFPVFPKRLCCLRFFCAGLAIAKLGASGGAGVRRVDRGLRSRAGGRRSAGRVRRRARSRTR